MYLRSLSIEHYRNHNTFRVEFDANHTITYIVGENARGKTNILEAMYLLALTKSFRTSKQQNLIQWEQPYARVKASLVPENPVAEKFASSRDGQLELEIFLGNPPQPLKVLKRNNVKVSAANFIGHCQVVFFHPEDLNMLYLGPELRRRYLDILNLQVNSDYYRALRTYRRVLTQRNALLRSIREGLGHPRDLAVWDEQLAEQGSYLVSERLKTVEFLKQYLQDYYQKISSGAEKIEIEYQSSTLGEPQNFRQKLAENLARDLKACVTTTGPHRDDLRFYLNAKPLEQHASRGEYRSLLLALKLLELRFLEERSGERPLLLLDDVFSELDLGRQKMLLEAIQSHQTIITATHYHDIYNFRKGQTIALT